MSGTQIFPSITKAESKIFSFNFQASLSPLETISSAQVAASVWSGVDPSPSGIVSGAASISGANVNQMITTVDPQGVLGVVYTLTCTAVTSLGQTLTLSGYLAITPVVD